MPTRVRFTRDIIEDADGDHPDLLWAKKGEEGWLHDELPVGIMLNNGNLISCKLDEFVVLTAKNTVTPEPWIETSVGLPHEDVEVEIRHDDINPIVRNNMKLSHDGWLYLSVFNARGTKWWFTTKAPTHWRYLEKPCPSV